MDKTTMSRDLFLRHTTGIQFYRCNNCIGISIALDYGMYGFCPYCGLEIDWENSNE